MMGWQQKSWKRRKLERKRESRVVRILQKNEILERKEELFETIWGWNRRRHTANSMRFES